MEAHVHTIISSVPVSDSKFELIKLSTERDMQLVTLKEFILSGWPETRKECPAAIIDFWNHRHQLSFSCGLIMKGHKIVIPKRTKVRDVRNCPCWPHVSRKMSKETPRHNVLAQNVQGNY